jgi:hypothetical protein
MEAFYIEAAQYNQDGGAWWSSREYGLVYTGRSGSHSYITRLTLPFNSIWNKNGTHRATAANLRIFVSNAYSSGGGTVRITDENNGVLATCDFPDTNVRNGWLVIPLTQGAIDALMNSSAYYIGTYSTAAGSYFEYYTYDANRGYVEIEWTPRTTACGASTSAVVGPAVFESDVALSWEGASGGINNAIAGYEMQFGTSSDGSNWSGYTTFQIVNTGESYGSLTDYPGIARGTYQRYRMRTLGTAGPEYYSDWTYFGQVVRKNRVPNTPPSPEYAGGLGWQGSPEYYPESVAHFQWGATNDPDGQGVTYQVQPKVRNAPDTAWIDDGPVLNAGGSLGYDYSIANKSRGQSLWYNVRAIDSLGAAGDWTGPHNAYYRNRIPEVPLVAFPVEGAVIYNTTPRVGLTMASDADGDTMAGRVSVGGILAVSDGANSGYWSRSGRFSAGAKAVIRGAAVDAGARTIEASANDGKVTSSVVSRTVTVTTPVWTDSVLVPWESKLRVGYIQDLRTAVNNVRAYYGLSACSWRHPVLVPNESPWSLAYIEDLRTAIEEIIAFVNGFDPTNSTHDIPMPLWTDPVLTPYESEPRIIHFTELRAIIPLL